MKKILVPTVAAAVLSAVVIGVVHEGGAGSADVSLSTFDAFGDSQARGDSPSAAGSTGGHPQPGLHGTSLKEASPSATGWPVLKTGHQAPIDIVLHEVNEATDQVKFIGGAKIIPSELGLGERTQAIGALSLSLYELTYKVL